MAMVQLGLQNFCLGHGFPGGVAGKGTWDRYTGSGVKKHPHDPPLIEKMMGHDIQSN